MASVPQRSLTRGLRRADPVRVLAHRLLAIALVPYLVWLVFAYDYHFLDGVNLAFHEAGHLFLSPFGQTAHMLGGTFAQLFVPGACALHFWRQGRSFEAAVCGLWLGESFMNVAFYLGDARALALPLVGGHLHDWNWLLGRAGLLAWCEELAALLHVGASLGAGVSVAWALRFAFEADPAAAEAPGAPQL